MNGYEAILEALEPADVYLQLAEEAAELSQAAAKMARLQIGRNPAAVTEAEAGKNLLEELSDVALCGALLNLAPSEEVMAAKLERWATRLREGIA